MTSPDDPISDDDDKAAQAAADALAKARTKEDRREILKSASKSVLRRASEGTRLR